MQAGPPFEAAFFGGNLHFSEQSADFPLVKMSSLNKRFLMNLKISIIVLAVVAGVGLMLFSTSEQEGYPQYRLNEFYQVLQENPDKLEDRAMTVFGFVKEGSVQRKGIQADFVIEQDDQSLNVHFTGKSLLPDTFEEGADVSLDGKYDAQNQLFIADKALAKCGSKYIPKGEGEGMSHPENIPKGN